MGELCREVKDASHQKLAPVRGIKASTVLFGDEMSAEHSTTRVIT